MPSLFYFILNKFRLCNAIPQPESILASVKKLRFPLVNKSMLSLRAREWKLSALVSCIWKAGVVALVRFSNASAASTFASAYTSASTSAFDSACSLSLSTTSLRLALALALAFPFLLLPIVFWLNLSLCNLQRASTTLSWLAKVCSGWLCSFSALTLRSKWASLSRAIKRFFRAQCRLFGAGWPPPPPLPVVE